MRDSIHCARLLAFVTGLVNQELWLQKNIGGGKPHSEGSLPDRSVTPLATTEGSGLASLWHQLEAKFLGRRLSGV